MDSPAEGQPIRQGQVLFEVAPLDAMLVEGTCPIGISAACARDCR